MRLALNALITFGLLACGSSTAATDSGVAADSAADTATDATSERPASDTAPPRDTAPVDLPPPDTAADAPADTATPFPCPMGLPGEYSFFRDGGNAPWQDRGTVTPPRAMLFVRDRFDTMSTRCPSTLADCGTADVVDLAEVTAALVHPDVQSSLARGTVLYGVDTRPADGQVFVIQRGMARVEVGSACRGAGACTPVPPGVQRAVDILQALLEQESTAPACRALLGGA
ncbi:MAG: hypothetical protein HY909_28775 [Deltaproteobacteria bacterium]|nr:hypothetical protein [Deltaproteobacteria bacterium]